MSEETAVVKQEEVASFPTYFAATNSEQMAKAQGGLTVWCESRLTQARMDRMELERAAEHARTHKWATKTLDYQVTKALKLELYYEKVLAALEKGFVLVPAFPIDVFAIRTMRLAPKPNHTYVKEGYDAHSNNAVHAEMAPVGQGEYVADEASRTQQYHADVTEKQSDGGSIVKSIYHFENEEFQDITFPMIACKPEVMNAAARAMTLKIFDEIGISTKDAGNQSRTYRRGDPLIIGAIYGPGPRYSRKQANFLISWHINLEDL